MSLDQFHRIGRYAGIPVSLEQGTGLTFRPRRINALGFAVTGRTDATYEGINTVAVPLGIVEPLQHQDADAFSQHRTVRIGGKGAGVTGMGQHTGFGETHVHEYIINRVDTAGDHHVAFTGIQFHQSQVKGAQAAGAGRIHHAVGAAQVQPVADATGDHIAQQAGKRVFLPWDITV